MENNRKYLLVNREINGDLLGLSNVWSRKQICWLKIFHLFTKVLVFNLTYLKLESLDKYLLCFRKYWKSQRVLRTARIVSKPYALGFSSWWCVNLRKRQRQLSYCFCQRRTIVFRSPYQSKGSAEEVWRFSLLT